MNKIILVAIAALLCGALFLTTHRHHRTLPPTAETPEPPRPVHDFHTTVLPTDEQLARSIQKGISFLLNDPLLKHEIDLQRNKGYVAWAVNALLKAGAAPQEKRLQEALAFLVSKPLLKTQGGYENIFAGVMLKAFAAHDPMKHRSEIRDLVAFLTDQQLPSGAWGFLDKNFKNGLRPNTCVTQYVLLGLDEASEGGMEVHELHWARAAEWLEQTQRPDGGWVCEPESPPVGKSFMSMTVAGLEGLLLCKKHLDRIAQPKESTRRALRQMGMTIPAALAWLEEHWRIKPGKTEGSTFDHSFAAAYLYDLMHLGELLKADRIAGHTWFPEAAAYMLDTQQEDGGWQDIYSHMSDEQIALAPSSRTSTSFALAFLSEGRKIYARLSQR